MSKSRPGSKKRGGWLGGRWWRFWHRWLWSSFLRDLQEEHSVQWWASSRCRKLGQGNSIKPHSVAPALLPQLKHSCSASHSCSVLGMSWKRTPGRNFFFHSRKIIISNPRKEKQGKNKRAFWRQSETLIEGFVLNVSFLKSVLHLWYMSMQKRFGGFLQHISMKIVENILSQSIKWYVIIKSTREIKQYWAMWSTNTSVTGLPPS